MLTVLFTRPSEDAKGAPAAPTLISVTNFQDDGSLVFAITLPSGTLTKVTVYQDAAGLVKIGDYSVSTSVRVPFADVSGLVATTPFFAITVSNAAGESPASDEVGQLVTYPKPTAPVVGSDGLIGNLVDWTGSGVGGSGSVTVYGSAIANENPPTAVLASGQPLSSTYDDLIPAFAGQTYYAIAGADNSISPKSDGTLGPN